jgi:hypothetical protein
MHKKIPTHINLGSISLNISSYKYVAVLKKKLIYILSLSLLQLTELKSGGSEKKIVSYDFKEILTF